MSFLSENAQQLHSSKVRNIHNSCVRVESENIRSSRFDFLLYKPQIGEYNPKTHNSCVRVKSEIFTTVSPELGPKT